MRSQFKRQTNSKVYIYAVAIALLLGVGAVVMQEIKVPTEHVVQVIEVDLDK
jgi:hypothetical protein